MRAETNVLAGPQAFDEDGQVLPGEWIEGLPLANDVLAGFEIAIDPVEKRVLDELLVERSAALEEGHGFEEVEDWFGFEKASGEQVGCGFYALSALCRPEEVGFEAEEQIDGLVEACPPDLPEKTG